MATLWGHLGHYYTRTQQQCHLMAANCYLDEANILRCFLYRRWHCCLSWNTHLATVYLCKFLFPILTNLWCCSSQENSCCFVWNKTCIAILYTAFCVPEKMYNCNSGWFPNPDRQGPSCLQKCGNPNQPRDSQGNCKKVCFYDKGVRVCPTCTNKLGMGLYENPCFPKKNCGVCSWANTGLPPPPQQGPTGGNF